MKKGIIGLFLFGMLALGGCQRSTDTFLAYEDIETTTNSVDSQLMESDFFAKDIAVITDEQNNGDDTNLNSGATLLINITDNKAIYADNVYERMYPASLTKLLTALVVLNYGELADSATVSYDATHIPETDVRVCGYEEGDIIPLEALLNSLIIYSGNDAAIAIADHVGGDEEAFVGLMNGEAVKIGAVDSNFVNSHGLHDDNQYTTAYDMYLVFNNLLKNDTFRSIISSETYTAVYTDKDGNEKQKTLDTTNLYLSGEEEITSGIEVIGGLSGATNKAGNCLILLCRDSNAKEYISIILNAPDSETLYSQMSYLLSLTASK